MRDSNAQFLTVIRTRSHVLLKRTALLSALTGMRLLPGKRDHPPSTLPSNASVELKERNPCLDPRPRDFVGH